MMMVKEAFITRFHQLKIESLTIKEKTLAVSSQLRLKKDHSVEFLLMLKLKLQLRLNLFLKKMKVLFTHTLLLSSIPLGILWYSKLLTDSKDVQTI